LLRLKKKKDARPMSMVRSASMAQTTAVIGIGSEELRWIRMLVALLRHPDPSLPELARQALLYLSDSAGDAAIPSSSVRARARHARPAPEL
jgi:hypothetical protein